MSSLSDDDAQRRTPAVALSNKAFVDLAFESLDAEDTSVRRTTKTQMLYSIRLFEKIAEIIGTEDLTPEDVAAFIALLGKNYPAAYLLLGGCVGNDRKGAIGRAYVL